MSDLSDSSIFRHMDAESTQVSIGRQIAEAKELQHTYLAGDPSLPYCQVGERGDSAEVLSCRMSMRSCQ